MHRLDSIAVRTRYLVVLILIALGAAEVRPERDAACAEVARSSTVGARLVYLKAEHQLCLFEQDGTLRHWPASHGRNAGKKQFEGDGRTPEGRYRVRPARSSERFGLFMPISYPSPEDVRAASVAGKPAGGDIGIHGPQRWYAFLGRAQALVDHSDGCIVVDADGMQELTARVRRPLPIDIVPAK